MKISRALVALILIATLLALNLPFNSTGEVPLGPPPAQGHWWVNDSTAINNTTIVVNDHLTINNTGKLELTNVTLIMNGNITVFGDFILRNATLIMNITGNISRDDYGIYVESGGLMHILDYDKNPVTNDGSLITSATSGGRHTYSFWVKSGSRFKMENSYIQECGSGYFFPGADEKYTNGLFVEADNIRIQNSTIDHSKNGLILKSSNGSIISNSTFSRGTPFESFYYGHFGVVIINGFENLVENCKFYNLMRGLDLYSSENNTITNCIINDSVKSITYDRRSLGINLEYSNNNQLINNTQEMYFISLFVSLSKNILIQNHTINGTYEGIGIMYGCENITLENIEISEVTTPYFDNPGIGMFFYSTITDVIVSNFSITSQKNTAVDGISWHSPFSSTNYLFRNGTINVSSIALAANGFGTPSWQDISDVIIEDSIFIGGSHAFTSFYFLDNWSFINCTFEKGGISQFKNLWNGIISLAGDHNDITFSDCDIQYSKNESLVSGLAISSTFDDLTFDIEFNNCRIFDNSEHGIIITNQGNNIGGNLLLKNCSINNNGRNGIYLSTTDVSFNLESSIISDNGYNGIRSEGIFDSEINVQNSTISDNIHSGISIFSSNSSVTYNIINSYVQDNNIAGLETLYSDCNLNLHESQFVRNNNQGLDITGTYSDIDNCTISNNLGLGISFKSGTGRIAYNNIISNGFEGAKINDSMGNIIFANNLIKNNGLINDISEVHVEDSTLTILNNTFTTNPTHQSKIGLKISNSNSVKIIDNTINGNFIESLIEISNSDVIIENNDLLSSGPEATAIYSYGQSFAQILNNLIIAEGKTGVLISDETFGPISGNTISRWQFGITLDNITANLNNNTIENSLYAGIYVKGITDVTLNDNYLDKNKIGVLVEGTTVMNRNTILNSSDSGIYIKNTGMAELFGNLIKANNRGVLVSSGMLKSNGNTYENNEYGLSLNNINNGLSIKDIIKDNEIGLDAFDSDIYISKALFIDNDEAVVLQGSYCHIYNSSIKGSMRNFKLDSDSHCWVLNTDMTENPIVIFETKSRLDRQWFLNLSIVDIATQPISDMTVTINDIDGNKIYSGTTSALGIINWLNLTSLSWSFDGSKDPNPYEIILSKKFYGTTRNALDFTGNTNSTLTGYKLSDIITHVGAIDTPNDQGGSITINWSHIPILNFDHYNFYVDTEYISSATMAPLNLSIYDQLINSTIISEINGEPLKNGIKYYFAVTVVDSDGFEDWLDVTSSIGIAPIDNLSPDPLKIINAFDTPNDNGGSITVTWETSTALDFEYYEIFSFSENISDYVEILNLTSKFKIRDVNKNQESVVDLTDGAQYYIAILVYDMNGNVNLSLNIIGPVTPLDNLPPVINTDESEPSITDSLEFYTNDRKNFKVIFSGEDVVFRWYLDEVYLENVTDPFYLLSMESLTPGIHNLTVIAEEPSELSDSIAWNFTVMEIPQTPTSDTSDQFFNWIALIILILILLIISLFGISFSYKYSKARQAIRTVPTMLDAQAIAFINKKREQGDKYILTKLAQGLPGTLQQRPDKLFMLSGILAKDDISEVRENGAKNIAKLLDKYPDKVFLWVRTLQNIKVKPEIYLIISKSSTNDNVKTLLKGYYQNLTAKSEEEYKSLLENTKVTLNRFEDIQFGREMNIIYSTLNDFSKYRTVSKISTSKPIIDRIQAYRGVTYNLIHPEAMDLFQKMGLVAESLGKYEKVESVEDKLSYLSQGINWIEDASKFTRDRLKSPEKHFFFLVLNSWRNIISMSIRELRGRADLSLSLIGKEIVADREKMTIMLEIENKGRSAAERVLVELVPSNDYVVRTGPQELGTVEQRKSKEITFNLKPRTTEAFRVEFTIRFDDSERKGKSISFGDLVTFIQMGAEFKEIPNPYIVGTPIKTGSKLFVGRRDLIDFIQKNIRGSLQENIIVLIGHRRTGKTTLLKQLPVYLDKTYVPVYIDIQGIIDPGMDAFFYLLATEIVSAMQERGIDISVPNFEEFKERPSFFFEYKFLKEVNDKLGETILVLMFDEFEELEVKVDSGLLDKNIFSYLRHLMQHTKQLAFIFTGSYRLEDLKTDYWSIMFNIAIYKRVGFLSKEETKELIIEPVKEYNMIYDPLALEKIFKLTFGHPYFTQLLCHALVNLHNSKKKNYITIQEVDQELMRIIERGQMHFDFIWDRSSLRERLVMCALTRVSQEEGAVTVSSMVNKLAEYDLTVDAKEITRTMDILAGKDIITKILDHTTTYEFKVDLIRIWLENTKHFDQVVEEYRVGL
jgi:parallel beta-helix repeat protein